LDAAPNDVKGASRSRPASSSKSAGCATCRSSPLSTSSTARGRDPVDLLDEIEQSLALNVTPAASWPIGMGRDFLGTYDLFADALLSFERGVHDRVVEPVRCSGLDDPQLPRLLPKEALAKLREEVEMAKGLCPPFDPWYREGHLTPVYFGIALNNFGVRELLAGVGDLAPAPRPQPADPRPNSTEEPKVAGFVFKVQANIDPQHRPHRLCAARVRPLPARHEIEEHPHRAPDVGAGPGVFPGARAQPCRGGLARRHHRHPQPREPQDRRHHDRERARPHHRHPELCAGDPAAGNGHD
jgi:hypothetical protein